MSATNCSRHTALHFKSREPGAPYVCLYPKGIHMSWFMRALFGDAQDEEVEELLDNPMEVYRGLADKLGLGKNASSVDLLEVLLNIQDNPAVKAMDEAERRKTYGEADSALGDFIERIRE